MTASQVHDEPKATRRRGPVLDAAIRNAVLAELREHGYGGITFANVAKRARTSRSVLYRRFPSRARLVADAMSQNLPPRAPHSSGTLKEDLQSLLDRIAHSSRQLGPELSRSLLGETDNAALRAALGEFRHSVVDDLTGIVEAARHRGELGPRPIPRVALQAPVWLLRSQALETSISAEIIADLVDNIALPLYRAHSAGDIAPGTGTDAGS